MVLYKTAPFQFQLLPQQILFREQRHQSAEGFFFCWGGPHTRPCQCHHHRHCADEQRLRPVTSRWRCAALVGRGKNTLHVFTCTPYIRHRARRRCLILSAILSPHSLYLTVQFSSDHFCCKFKTILKLFTCTSCDTAFKCLILCLFRMVASKFFFQISTTFVFTEQTWTISV